MAIYGSHFLFFYLLLTVIYSMFLKLKWTLCCHCPVFGGPWDLGVFENMADTLTSRNAETTKQNNEQNWFISQSEVGNPKYLVFHILFFFKPAPLRTSRLTWFSHHSSQGVKVLFFLPCYCMWITAVKALQNNFQDFVFYFIHLLFQKQI